MRSSTWAKANPTYHLTNLLADATLLLGAEAEAYVVATYSKKAGWKQGNHRQVTANTNIVVLFPFGGSPDIGLDKGD